MLDVEKLKAALVASGKLTPERLAEAEALAREQNCSLTEALVSGLMISYPDLGEACARVTGLPYQSLTSARGAAAAARVMSPGFALRAGVHPVAYEPGEHVLTVAVADPEQADRLEKLMRFFLQDVNLRFTIAPDIEIKRAGERHAKRPGGDGASAYLLATRQLAARQDERQTNTRVPAAQSAVPKDTETSGKDRHGGDEPAYAEMFQGLLSAATLVVRMQYGDEPDRLHLVRTRVRYCQLMATRLKFTRLQNDALTLAGWLSAVENREGVVAAFSGPYRIEEILHPERVPGKRSFSPRPEALALGLVKCYQSLRGENPDLCRDVSLTRRELLARWSSARERQHMVETFLQILVDEEFLEKMGRSAGRILIVDAEEQALCALAPPLIRVGYDVIAVPDTRTARDIMEEFQPDMVIVTVEEPTERALWFCERLKGDARTTGKPILALVPEGDTQFSVRSLRAGANDFLAKPINSELLFLKVQSHLSKLGVEVKECGVSGSLDEMSFTDMIQILCAGQRSVDLLLTSGSDEGRVYVRGGNVLHASLGELTGEAAFYAMMRWQTGTFTTRQCGECPEQSIHASTMSLLMEGSRQADESSGG